jgi:hypothetical protein
MDLVVCEMILAEELECDLHPPDGWDLSTELDEGHMVVGRTADERPTKIE